MLGNWTIMRSSCLLKIATMTGGLLIIVQLALLTTYNSMVPMSDSQLYKEDFLKIRSPNQRICIIAGPHKTGTSSIETNLWQWSSKSIEHGMKSEYNLVPPMGDSIISWVWPVPKIIYDIESKHSKSWDWNPSKIYYPLSQALKSWDLEFQRRPLFQNFTRHEVLKLYHDEIQKSWDDGHNIVIGTEGLDIIAAEKAEAEGILSQIQKFILPADVLSSQVTIVVAYRSPRVKHLVSLWLQINTKANDPQFQEWITNTDFDFHALDSLMMVDILLKYTEWNIILIDLKGITDIGWDISNFVACEVLNEVCEDKKPVGLTVDPARENSRSDLKWPDVSVEVLDEINGMIMDYECKYAHLLEENNRLEILHPVGLNLTMERCKSLDIDPTIRIRNEMRQKIVNLTETLKPNPLQIYNVSSTS